VTAFKVTGHSKIIFFVGFPPSENGLKNVSVNARVSGYLDLKFIYMSLLAKFS